MPLAAMVLYERHFPYNNMPVNGIDQLNTSKLRTTYKYRAISKDYQFFLNV
jgi:hypothetical protein